ncbi:MAG: T9SS type A sorting domain-containing protein [Candidatus Eisenbacteria bacterium]
MRKGHRSVPTSLAATLVAVALVAGPASAGPVVEESGWELLYTRSLGSAQSAIIHPTSGDIYVGVRESNSSGGLYRIDRYGFASQVAGGSNPAGLVADPDSGFVFVSEDFGGHIFRTDPVIGGRLDWVGGFHSGDDDPVGMDFAPSDYSGPFLLPGDGVVVDRGSSGADEIWMWNPYSPEGEVQIHADNGTLADAVDVTVSPTDIFVADPRGGSPGVIWRLLADGTLEAASTSLELVDPVGIDYDFADGSLLVADRGLGQLLRVALPSGETTVVLSGLDPSVTWAGVDLTSDGRRMVITEAATSSVHFFAQCAPLGPEEDCDGNGISDLCDIARGTLADCNQNGVPDVCDIESGTSQDCNLDGIPDECPQCPPVEVVFVMDTSASMDGEASALCGSIEQVTAHLEASGIAATATYLGITTAPGGAYGCLEGTVLSLYGDEVPGDPPPGIETLLTCPGGDQGPNESWGQATSIVAGLHPWAPEGESIRLVIPIGDEGPWCGDPANGNDQLSIDHAITVAVANGVIVSPITGSGSSETVIALARQLAEGTGGEQFSSSTPSLDLAQAVVDLVENACATFTDCNDNGILDSCDIASGTSEDENGDGIPDECGATSGVGDGLASGTGRDTIAALTARPNPVISSTKFEFQLHTATDVRLTVFDAAGRKVTDLLSTHLPAGLHVIDWNATDTQSNPVPAGVYFYRLQTPNGDRSERLVVVR